MKHSTFERIATISFAIFAMYFGAGNLIYPLRVGMFAGQHTWMGFLGFALTGVVLPVIGLLAMVAFNGDYKKFFYRLGRVPGDALILFCMLVIGPLFAMPRIVTLSYEMTQPFLPAAFVGLSSATLIFSALFCLLGYIITSRPGQLLDIIGKFLSPALVVALIIFIGASVVTGTAPDAIATPAWDVFKSAFRTGFATLDILASIFFSSIIVTLLSKYSKGEDHLSVRDAVKTVSVSGLIAGLMFGSVYLGVTFIAALHGHGLVGLNEGAIFSKISFDVLGVYGAALMSTIVLLAGFTTIVALAAVVGEYLQLALGKRASYLQAVAGVLFATAIMANLGLGKIMEYSEPLIDFFYPLIIVTTLCNLAYKLFGFEYIKLPVAVTALVMVPSLVQSIMALWQ